MSKVDPQQVIKDISGIYTLPTAYHRINAAIDDPGSSNSQIGAIISEDPGLAARVLRLANSAFYNFPSKIDSVAKAITILGTQQIRDLVLATSVIKVFSGISEEIVTMKSFWQHSIACGVTAKIIASQRREPNIESYFLAGLLHDIGSLILYTGLPKAASQIVSHARKHNKLLHLLEKKALGFDHAQLGGMLLKEWKLPKHLCDAVTNHHQPKSTDPLHFETESVHVGDIIVHSLQFGSNGENFVPKLDSKAWKRLGQKESSVNNYFSLLETQYDDIVSALLDP